ncbi:hypothetical protein ACS0TY_028420 [Phlomoides rotata]
MMMFQTRKALCLLTFICFVVSEYKGEGYKVAPSCHRYECPPYNVTHTQIEFEIRSYDKAQWVKGPGISSNSFNEAANKGYRILSAYFDGNNTEHRIIKMTTLS